MRNSEEIKQYFMKLLNDALHRLSMYGGEISVRYFLQHIAFIDQRSKELEQLFRELSDRGAFLSGGIESAFRNKTGLKPSDGEIASFYVEIAFKMGYFQPHNVFAKTEYKKLLDKYLSSTLDMNTDQVIELFGEPSWRCGSNPLCPWVFLYILEGNSTEFVAFDFWNSLLKQDERVVHGKYGKIPILKNIRMQSRCFSDSFFLTPTGKQICQEERDH